VHANAKLIESFYLAFQKRDGAAMEACYHPDIHFSDPVFPDLRGPRAGGMWRMLTSNKASDATIEFRDIDANDTTGKAHWDARYTWPQTGRKVLNVIDATFEFKDGKIIRHDDSFDLWKWTRMALGPVGYALGWSPIVRNKVRKLAAGRLEAFLAGKPAP
jgi:ketosteroid isomerase-like protein